MNNPDFPVYRKRLLNGEIPYAIVKKNLHELNDHHYDLVQEAMLSVVMEHSGHCHSNFQQIVWQLPLS